MNDEAAQELITRLDKIIGLLVMWEKYGVPTVSVTGFAVRKRRKGKRAIRSSRIDELKRSGYYTG